MCLKIGNNNNNGTRPDTLVFQNVISNLIVKS